MKTDIAMDFWQLQSLFKSECIAQNQDLQNNIRKREIINFLKKELISKARKMVFFKIEKHSNIGKKYLKNTIIYNILVLYRIVKMMFSSWARGEGASFLLTQNLN